MALFSISHAGVYLGMNVPLTVIYPDGANRKNPPKVLYLLHGLSDDDTMWVRRSNVERYCDGRNLCVVMPTGHRGFYTDMEKGLMYFSYLSTYLPKFTENVFCVATGRENTFVAGLSMGGYGAVKLALSRPDAYAAAASFSGVLDPSAHRDIGEFELCFGKSIKPENDTMQLLDACIRVGGVKPRLYICCGTEDMLLPDSVKFSEKAKGLGYELEYDALPGNHEWEFWDGCIKKLLSSLPL